MDDKKLYPLRFEPVVKDHPWGRERVCLADLGYLDSTVSGGWLDGSTIADVMETYMDRVVGDNVYYYYGRQFPVMVSSFRTTRRTPLVVCPDDVLALERYDSLGRRKLWYVADARPGSVVGIGLKQATTATDFYYGCLDGSVLPKVRTFPVRRGDVFVIAPGTVHFAGPGLSVVEIAESSALDFYLSLWGERDYGTDPDVVQGYGVEEALDFIDLGPYKASDPPPGGGSSPIGDFAKLLCAAGEFHVSEIALPGTLHFHEDENLSFLLYHCVEGDARIDVCPPSGTMESYPLPAGGTILLPTDAQDFFMVPLRGGTVVLEATVRKDAAPESYIGAEPQSEGEGDDLSGEEFEGWSPTLRLD